MQLQLFPEHQPISVGLEIEFWCNDSNDLDYCPYPVHSEYYSRMYEVNGYHVIGTPEEQAKAIKNYIKPLLRTPFIFDKGVSVASGVAVWAGVHLHIGIAGESMKHAGLARRLAKTTYLWQKDLYAKNGLVCFPKRLLHSHHIWGGVTDDWEYSYQRKDRYKPVAYRNNLGTYEVRLLSMLDLCLAREEDLERLLLQYKHAFNSSARTWTWETLYYKYRQEIAVNYLIYEYSIFQYPSVFDTEEGRIAILEVDYESGCVRNTQKQAA